MTDMPHAVPAGRPPVLIDAERRMLILQSSETVFHAVGYGDATMEEVARGCGMAKKTVYRFFPDKAALFAALVESHDIFLAGADARALGFPDVSERLRFLLGTVASFILSPRQLMLSRLVIGEARKSPELAERFYRGCVERIQDFFVRELQSLHPATARGEIDPRILADICIGATLGILQFRALMLNLDEAELKRELSDRIDDATATVVRLLDSVKA